jgi:uncharacterized protein YaiI (UPF0178 family)
MLDLFVDIDACRVYPEILSAAMRHPLDLCVVTWGYVDAGPPIGASGRGE